MKFRWDKKYLHWGITALAVIACGIILFFLMFRGANFKAAVGRIISILMPVIDGLILAYLFTPIMNYFEKTILRLLKKDRFSLTVRQQKYLRAVGIFFTLVFAISIVYGFCAVVLPQLFRSIQSIIFQFPVYINNLNIWLDKILADNPQIEAYLTEIVNTYTPSIREWLNGTLIPQMNQAIRVVSGYVSGIVTALWNLIIGLILSVYLMAGKEKFIAQLKKLIYAVSDVKNANQFIDDMRFVHQTFGGFINGKLLDSLIIGLLCFAGTTLIGTPYPVLISVIIGVTNIIPFFGPYLGAIPSAVLILMIDPIQCLYFLIFILILQQFDGNILGPRILGNSTGLSSFWVIFSITLFGGIFGVPGMVIGVPAFAVLYAFLRRYVNSRLSQKQLPTETEEYKELYRINDKNREIITHSSDMVHGNKGSAINSEEENTATASQNTTDDTSEESYTKELEEE